MQNRTWGKIWLEVKRIAKIAGAEDLTSTQANIVQAVVDEYTQTPRKARKKVKKNGKKRAYTRKAKVDAGSQETPVVAKKRGRKPKAISTTDAVGEPATVGASSANDPGWGV